MKPLAPARLPTVTAREFAGVIALIGSGLILTVADQITLKVGAGAALLALGFVAWDIAYFGPVFPVDPSGYGSLTAPPILLLAGGALDLRLAPFLILIAGAWFTATLANERFWNWWLSIVLLRPRPGSVERRALSTSRRLIDAVTTQPLRPAEIDRLLDLLWQLRTTKTRALTDGSYALADMTGMRATDSRKLLVRRALRRLAEERRWLMLPRVAFVRPWPDRRFLRPTRGTRLEFSYPQLEALVAVANPDQLRRVAVSAARAAARDVGVDTAPIRAALENLSPESSAAGVAEAERLSAAVTGTVPADVKRYDFALRAIERAIAERIRPVDAAEALYEALKAHLTPETEARLIEEVRSIVGPAQDRAIEIEPAPQVDAISRSYASAAAQFFARPKGMGGLVTVTLVALGAGILGAVGARLVQVPLLSGAGEAIAAVIAAAVYYGVMRRWSEPGSWLAGCAIAWMAVAAWQLDWLLDAGFELGPTRDALLLAGYAIFLAMIVVFVRWALIAFRSWGR